MDLLRFVSQLSIQFALFSGFGCFFLFSYLRVIRALAMSRRKAHAAHVHATMMREYERKASHLHKAV